MWVLWEAAGTVVEGYCYENFETLGFLLYLSFNLIISAIESNLGRGMAAGLRMWLA